jgi:hypothetical protein
LEVLLKPEQIRVDGGTQPRAELLFDVMDDYAEQMRCGVKFPPITVFFDGKDYWLADGFHRLGAHLRAFTDDTPIEAEVLQGSRLDAQWYSFGANKAHGMRRAKGDKERAVSAALDHPRAATLSNGQIAEHCGVSEITVRRYRKRVGVNTADSASGEAPTSTLSKSNFDERRRDDPDFEPARPRTGRDGRTINTAKIGRSASQKARKPRSSTELAEARRNGYRGPMTSLVKLALPNNHVHNCAYGLLAHFTFEYLEKVFREITHIHQERLQKENSK